MKRIYTLFSVLVLMLGLSSVVNAQVTVSDDLSDASSSQKNQAVITLKNGEKRYYNTETLGSIDFEGSDVKVNVGSKSYTFKNNVAGISFRKAEKKSGAKITKTIRNEEKKATIYNFEYPSQDPFGKPVTLSGSIIVGDEVDANGKKAAGTVLYNHFTVFQKDQCPSHGDLAVPLVVVGSKMIVVAADYYGFGVTESKNQAYCIPSANAQASVDALIAARQLLKEKGYTWDDILFNAGYSQGGQTAIGVLRLLAEKHPEIKVTHTIAGGGPYDIGETYRQLVSKGESTMPSTVISSVLSYNEYFSMGVDYATVFKEEVLKNIPEYLLSKKYRRSEMEGKLSSNKFSEIFQPDMSDFNSALSKRFMETFEKDNLCSGWTPRKTERITLVHHEDDGCVPYANATKMADYLESQGLTVYRQSPGDKKYEEGSVYLYKTTGKLFPKNGEHENGAIPFAFEFANAVKHYLNLKELWFKLTDLDLGDF